MHASGGLLGGIGGGGGGGGLGGGLGGGGAGGGGGPPGLPDPLTLMGTALNVILGFASEFASVAAMMMAVRSSFSPHSSLPMSDALNSNAVNRPPAQFSPKPVEHSVPRHLVHTSFEAALHEFTDKALPSAAAGGGIPALPNAQPLNLGSIMSMSSTQSSGSDSPVTTQADSMLANLQSSNGGTVVRCHAGLLLAVGAAA